eukprot:CAMPEP_0171697024 /NCGR_PEP_ID=MMETSP0991-20121206/8598_1 /TAXON_ID=483369 /ORGANISM="non described non described, Strain CCMP2098" /LENGTH=48 /DNA_ID= /DNA_START= /DNA_END= /DNA_ORIENTATION=
MQPIAAHAGATDDVATIALAVTKGDASAYMARLREVNGDAEAVSSNPS